MIIRGAINVHKELGPGLLPSVEKTAIVKLKSVKQIENIHKKQL